MIGSVSTSSSFAALAAYLEFGSGPEAAARAARGDGRLASVKSVHLSGVADPALAGEVMLATVEALNARVEKPVLHLIIAPAPQDRDAGRVTDASLIAMGHRTLRDMELSEHQAFMVVHRDTDDPHLHIMVSTVHPETGRVWNGWQAYVRLERVLRAMEVDWQLRVVPGTLAPVPERTPELRGEQPEVETVAGHTRQRTARGREVFDTTFDEASGRRLAEHEPPGREAASQSLTPPRRTIADIVADARQRRPDPVGPLERVPERTPEPALPGARRPAELDDPDRPPGRTKGEVRRALRTAEPSLLDRARAALDAIRASGSWDELDRALAARGLQFVARDRGIVFTDGVTAVKASRAAPDVSRGALEARFGESVATYAARREQEHAADRVTERTPEHAEAIRVEGTQVVRPAGVDLARLTAHLRAAYDQPDAARLAIGVAVAGEGVGAVAATLREVPEQFGALRVGAVAPEAGVRSAVDARAAAVRAADVLPRAFRTTERAPTATRTDADQHERSGRNGVSAPNSDVPRRPLEREAPTPLLPALPRVSERPVAAEVPESPSATRVIDDGPGVSGRDARVDLAAVVAELTRALGPTTEHRASARALEGAREAAHERVAGLEADQRTRQARLDRAEERQARTGTELDEALGVVYRHPAAARRQLDALAGADERGKREAARMLRSDAVQFGALRGREWPLLGADAERRRALVGTGVLSGAVVAYYTAEADRREVEQTDRPALTRIGRGLADARKEEAGVAERLAQLPDEGALVRTAVARVRMLVGPLDPPDLARVEGLLDVATRVLFAEVCTVTRAVARHYVREVARGPGQDRRSPEL